MARKSVNDKKPSFFLRLIKDSSFTLMSLIITGLIIVSFIYIYFAIHLPDVEQLRDVHLQVPLQVYTVDGKLMAEFGEKRRIPVTLNKVPKQLIWAILDTEDQRFYNHAGVDLIGLLRAAKNVLLTGKKTQGASTITMQVARNFFLNREKTYTRKINEILLALKIDHTFGKDAILELYLNKIYLGQRAYGVAAAAKIYFGKTLDQLTLPEMALIAGLPQAPSRDNPISDPEAAKERRDHVLLRMMENNHISNKEYRAAVASSIEASYHEQTTETQAPYVAEMVRQAMVEQFGDNVYDMGLKVYTTIDSRLQSSANSALREGVIAYDKRHGYRGAEQNLGSFNRNKLISWQETLFALPEINGLLPAAVLTVSNNSVTAMLSNGQSVTIPWSNLSWARRQLNDNYVSARPKRASDILHVGDVIRVNRLANGSWELMQVPQAEGSFVVISPNNGAILALVGGFSYTKSSFNRVLNSERQTGSALKPFIYAAALNKNFTLASVLNDAPLVIADSANTLWRPQEDTLQFYGPTRLRVGIMKSRNLVSIRLLQAITIPYAISYLQRFGFNAEQLPYGLSLALGTSNLSPAQLAGGYAVFANGGYKVTPFFIKEVKDQNGKTVFVAAPTVVPDPNSSVAKESQTLKDDAIQSSLSAAQNNKDTGAIAPRVITAQTAYLIYDALKDVIRQGTGEAASAIRRTDLAGKTGTTNDQNDAWFCGFNSDLVAIAWMGFDQPHSLYEHGAVAALPIWVSFMREALAGAPTHDFAMPPDIVKVVIDASTGVLAAPKQRGAIDELFLKGTEPTQTESTAFTDDFKDGVDVAAIYAAPPAPASASNLAPKAQSNSAPAQVAPVASVPSPAPAAATAPVPQTQVAPKTAPIQPPPATNTQKKLPEVITPNGENIQNSNKNRDEAPVEDDSSEAGLDQLF